MRNSFEYYKQLLADMSLDPSVVKFEHADDIYRSSVEEKGKLAFACLQDLDRCYDALKLGRYNNDSRSILLGLSFSLSTYNGFSRENFTHVLNNGSLHTMCSIVLNSAYPLSFLVNDDLYIKYKGSPDWLSLATALGVGRTIRFDEVVNFFRENINDTEHMTDEMVLSVAGIVL